MNFIKNLNEAFDKLLEKIGGWIDATVLALPNIVLAIIVMVIAGFASRYVRKYFSKLARRFTKTETVVTLISSIGTVAFMLLVIFLVLTILNLSSAVTSLLTGAGVAGLIIGLALQDPLINLTSGVIMSVRDLYNVGDLVETNGYFGAIRQVNLRTTIVELNDGPVVTIPNKLVLQNPLTNYSSPGQRRAELACGISYGEDLERVKAIAIRAIEEQVNYNKEKDLEFFYTEFGDSSINFLVRFWLDQVGQAAQLQAQSQAVLALKKAFDENDIMIPFPIRTLDFGIKGGEKLNEMLGGA